MIELICAGFFDQRYNHRLAYVVESNELIDARKIAEGMKKIDLFYADLLHDYV